MKNYKNTLKWVCSIVFFVITLVKVDFNSIRNDYISELHHIFQNKEKQAENIAASLSSVFGGH